MKLLRKVLRHFLFIDIQNFLWTISIFSSFDRETVNNTTNSQRESSWQNETKSIGKPQYISPLKLYWIKRKWKCISSYSRWYRSVSCCFINLERVCFHLKGICGWIPFHPVEQRRICAFWLINYFCYWLMYLLLCYLLKLYKKLNLRK